MLRMNVSDTLPFSSELSAKYSTMFAFSMAFCSGCPSCSRTTVYARSLPLVGDSSGSVR